LPDPRDTPAMRQYYRFKREHPECALFFRIGDFYEMFDDDAVRVSRALGLTLTQRTEGVPMCGVPHHQLENYLRRAIEAGFRVAVCEQVQEAAQVKAGAIIERAVTRVLTPGTLVDETLLSVDTPAPLACVCFTGSGEDSPAACAVVDLSTGQFEVFGCTPAGLVDELARRSVTELVYVQTADGKVPPRVRTVLDALGVSGTAQPAWHFRAAEAREALLKHFGVSTLEGFGLSESDELIQPAGAIIRYLESTQCPGGAGDGGPARPSLVHLRPPRRVDGADHCVLDATTLRSLEVFRTIRPGAGPGGAGSGGGAGAELDGSLLGVFAPGRTFPGCRTSLGKRLLREWLARPLLSLEAIRTRQGAVSVLSSDARASEALGAALSGVQDIARIGARLALGRATPRDLVALGRSLEQVGPVHEAVRGAPALAPWAGRAAALADELAPLARAIREACVDTPPAHLREGGLIRDGVDAELDEARRLRSDAAGWMAEYQARLIAEHDLPSLKVGFNSIFGYYIELPSAQSRRAPASFSRKQTLKSAERYVTPELKEFESRVMSAESRALAREAAIFESLCRRASKLIAPIGAFADAVAELDALWCLAEKARRRGWVRPEVVAEPVLRIVQGRHPVLDERLEGSFVPNDLALGVRAREGDAAEPRLALITGPNMAGKSTYIRTAALLTLLAHTGSFVPAESMTVGLTDRIFTRIGADDALHSGQSTFMVEMTETARILNHASARSLVVLDEIGRGTSTLDGLSLAWAIAETLAGGSDAVAESRSNEVDSASSLRGSDTRSFSPRVLFATHYHELTDLQERLPGRVGNLHVQVREWGDQIVFLHRIVPGRTDQSYGIHVAKLAGIPEPTIRRAREVLDTLAVQHHGPAAARAHALSPPAGPTPSKRNREPAQLSLFTEYVAHPAVDRLRELKLDGLTPLAAFDLLRTLHGLARDAQGRPDAPR
jgi:DNA mismatch repair protein MutS